MQVKICGLTSLRDVDYVNEALPDYAGFIFYPKSRRLVSESQAAAMKKKLDKRIQAVGVFVDEESQVIVRLLLEGTIDIAQLHGKETESTIAMIKEKTGRPVWKAVVPQSAEEAEAWQHSVADCLLFDGGKGEGKPFGWEYLKNVRRPFLLAGGMNFQRLKEISSMPYLKGVDVSSGVETDGIKDGKKILEFVQEARRKK